MRQFLITKLICADCGAVLTLNDEAFIGNIPYCEGEPSGGFRKENVVLVNPCKTCAAPADAVIDAVKTLLKAASK